MYGVWRLRQKLCQRSDHRDPGSRVCRIYRSNLDQGQEHHRLRQCGVLLSFAFSPQGRRVRRDYFFLVRFPKRGNQTKQSVQGINKNNVNAKRL